MEQLCRKCAPNLAPGPFSIKSKHTLHTGNSFENEKFWKMIIKKPLKIQLYFFFRTQSLLMDKVIKNKRGLEVVISHSSGYKTSPEKFFYSLYIIWPSLMMYCEAAFELFQKLHLQIYASQFMTSYIIPLPLALLNLEKVERMGKITKNGISWEQRAFKMK